MSIEKKEGIRCFHKSMLRLFLQGLLVRAGIDLLQGEMSFTQNDYISDRDERRGGHFTGTPIIVSFSCLE